MFTGIIEQLGRITGIRDEGSNRHFDVEVPFTEAIRVDQSIAHNGVCLTVTHIHSQSKEAGARYAVTAVEESLGKTNLGDLRVGDVLNIERCMRIGDRLDGHFVQGHVDDTGLVRSITDRDGSWIFEIAFDGRHAALLVDKGSVCVNGVSLTVVSCGQDSFRVAIIPFTYTHTNFQFLRVGMRVNLEFDILGKYIHKLMQGRPLPG